MAQSTIETDEGPETWVVRCTQSSWDTKDAQEELVCGWDGKRSDSDSCRTDAAHG